MIIIIYDYNNVIKYIVYHMTYVVMILLYYIVVTVSHSHHSQSQSVTVTDSHLQSLFLFVYYYNHINNFSAKNDITPSSIMLIMSETIDTLNSSRFISVVHCMPLLLNTSRCCTIVVEHCMPFTCIILYMMSTR